MDDFLQITLNPHDNGIDGEQNSGSVLEEIRRMSIENRDVVEIAIERKRSSIAGTISGEVGKPSRLEICDHFLAGCGRSDNGRLLGHNGQPHRFPNDTHQLNVVVQNPVGKNETLKVFAGQRANESRLSTQADHGEAVGPGVCGFEVKPFATLYAMFFTAGLEIIQ